MKKGFLFCIGRFLVKILIIEILIIIVTTAICWIGGWRTLSEFGNGLIYVGIVALVFGTSSVLGSTRLARDPTIRYVQTVSAGDLGDRSRRHMRDLAESNAFLILMGIVGIISIALGTWLGTISN
jgi:hypothetical protein